MVIYTVEIAAGFSAGNSEWQKAIEKAEYHKLQLYLD